MKRTYLAKHKTFFSPGNFSWGVCALAFSILIFVLRFFAPNLFWKAFTPVFRASDSFAVKSHSFVSSFGNAEMLSAKNEQLTEENVALANENQMLLQKEGSVSEDTPGISADVVARPPESPYDSLVLAAGSDIGVTLGMEAFDENGVPIGIVSSVLADFSRVTLFSAPGTTTNGWIGNANIPITIFGAGGGAMNAAMSRSADIAVGDTIFVSGPGELPIGRIVRIDGSASSPSVTLRIMPDANLFSTVWVSLRDTGASSFVSATTTQL
jgi:cell shape-determining protein MreC